MEQATGTPNLDSLAEVYDQHEVRTAIYLDRGLTHGERMNLALQGLTASYRNGHSVDDFERASDLIEAKLEAGQTVGQALAQTLREMEG